MKDLDQGSYILPPLFFQRQQIPIDSYTHPCRWEHYSYDFSHLIINLTFGKWNIWINTNATGTTYCNNCNKSTITKPCDHYVDFSPPLRGINNGSISTRSLFENHNTFLMAHCSNWWSNFTRRTINLRIQFAKKERDRCVWILLPRYQSSDKFIVKKKNKTNSTINSL